MQLSNYSAEAFCDFTRRFGNADRKLFVVVAIFDHFK